MDEPRKLRETLTEAEMERLKKFGAIEFKSIRRTDMRVLPFLPSKDRH